jgi:hypothetical protein
MSDPETLRAIERRLRQEEPELARTMDSFTAAAVADPVPRWVAWAILLVATLLVVGWSATGDPGLLAGAASVVVCTPIAWLVRLARRVTPPRR